MANSPLIKSGLNMTTPRGRLARPDRRAYYGSLAMFDTKPALYAGQGSNFTSFIEGIFGGMVTYFAPAAGDAVTFANGIVQLPANTGGNPGWKIKAYNDANYKDLADLETAGSKRFLIIGWLKNTVATDNFLRTLFHVGQGGEAITSQQCHFFVGNRTVGVTLVVAGQSLLFGQPIPQGFVGQIAFDIVKDPTNNITSATMYLTPAGQTTPVSYGKASAPYAAFTKLTAGGIAVGNASTMATSGSVPAAGYGFGRFDVQDLRLTQNDPLAEILLDLKLNTARFS